MPTDLLLIEGNGIKMDEKFITGESYFVRKEIFQKCLGYKNKNSNFAPSPLILSGTNCIEGSGKGIVLCVGEHNSITSKFM